MSFIDNISGRGSSSDRASYISSLTSAGKETTVLEAAIPPHSVYFSQDSREPTGQGAGTAI